MRYRNELGPDELLEWAIAIALGLVFVSCGVSALVGVFR